MALKRTLSEALGELAQVRTAKAARAARTQEVGWEPVSIDEFAYEFEDMPKDLCFPTLGYRAGHSTMLDIFLTFVDQRLVEDVLDGLPLNAWTICKARKQYFQPTVNQIYVMLAVYIRIQGLQKVALENKKNSRPLDNAVQEAVNHFHTMFPEKQCVGITRLQMMMSRFLLTNRYYKSINKNFQSIVKKLGQYVAGDEKLLHFTGNASNIRIVLSKPDRVGLWFYQLTTPLACGLPFMLYGRLHDALSTVNESIPTREIIGEWADVVQRVHVDPATADPNCILTMDSYYLCTASRVQLSQRKVKYVASVTKERFGSLADMVKENVTRPGEWSGVYKAGSAETMPELFVYNWDNNKDVGKKFCLTNAFKKVRRTRGGPKTIIPAYDAYKCMFNVCDRFNRNLHDRKWPHKRGGHGTLGEFGHQHNFFMSCCLQNTINAYLDIEKINPEMTDFEALTLELADSLYSKFATTI